MKTRSCHIAAVFVFVLAAAGVPTPSSAQPAAGPDAWLHELVLRDGSRLFGTIERQSEQEIVFRTHAGALVIARREDVGSLRRVEGSIEDGEFYPTDSHRTRLFFAPTARSLHRGQVSLGVFEISMPFVQVGVTDRFSVGGGTPLIFGFDESNRPFWITPKLQVFDDGGRQAAVGVIHLFNAAGDGGGIAYAVGTFGDPNKSVTVGAGLAYADAARGGLVMIGGERRVRSNLKVITENYIWKSGGIVSAGVRFLGERLSADLGLAAPFGGADTFFFAFPVVNFVYVF